MIIPSVSGLAHAVPRTVPTITKYVYVLQLRNGIRYVGSTQSLRFRLWEHFSFGGAIATRESPPVRVEQLYAYDERWHHNGANLLRLEAYIASLYVDRYGSRWIRGAMHGYGWHSCSSSADRRFVRRSRIFFETKAGIALWSTVRAVDPNPYQPTAASFALSYPLRQPACLHARPYFMV